MQKWAYLSASVGRNFSCAERRSSSSALRTSYRPNGGGPEGPARQSRASDDADAPVDHFLELFAVRTGEERGIEGDLARQVQARQCLVGGLHPDLFLTGLHRRVNLVDF